MLHDAHGWWIAEAGPPPALPPLAEDAEADVVVIGGGFTGLWTAWHVLEAEPGARVVVLEADRCGFGPSGRNGGFVQSHDAEPGDAARAVRRPRAATSSSPPRRRRSARSAPGARPRASTPGTTPRRTSSCTPRRARRHKFGAPGEGVVALDAAQVRARCDSPLFTGGLEAAVGATVHPARLAFGLRERLLARGVRIHEGTRACAASTARSRGRTRAACAPAPRSSRSAPASGALPPLRDRLTVSSSHIVLTEPVPDVVEAIGWTGGEAISDGRTLLHYLRTTRDGRILFGWAGGRMAAGARPGGRMEVDPEVIARARRRPASASSRRSRAAGSSARGAARSTSRRPTCRSSRRSPAAARTPPSASRATASARRTSRAARSPRSRSGGPGGPAALPIVGPPPRVPPEPLRVIGAAAIRRALVAKEAAEQDGRRPNPLVRALAALPGRMGMHIVR